MDHFLYQANDMERKAETDVVAAMVSLYTASGGNGEETLVYSICQFLWSKYSHHFQNCQFQTTDGLTTCSQKF